MLQTGAAPRWRPPRGASPSLPQRPKPVPPRCPRQCMLRYATSVPTLAACKWGHWSLGRSPEARYLACTPAAISQRTRHAELHRPGRIGSGSGWRPPSPHPPVVVPDLWPRSKTCTSPRPEDGVTCRVRPGLESAEAAPTVVPRTSACGSPNCKPYLWCPFDQRGAIFLGDASPTVSWPARPGPGPTWSRA